MHALPRARLAPWARRPRALLPTRRAPRLHHVSLRSAPAGVAPLACCRCGDGALLLYDRAVAVWVGYGRIALPSSLVMILRSHHRTRCGLISAYCQCQCRWADARSTWYCQSASASEQGRAFDRVAVGRTDRRVEQDEASRDGTFTYVPRLRRLFDATTIKRIIYTTHDVYMHAH